MLVVTAVTTSIIVMIYRLRSKMSNLYISNVFCHKIAPVSVRMGIAKLTGPADLDEIRGMGKTTRNVPTC